MTNNLIFYILVVRSNQTMVPNNTKLFFIRKATFVLCNKRNG